MTRGFGTSSTSAEGVRIFEAADMVALHKTAQGLSSAAPIGMPAPNARAIPNCVQMISARPFFAARASATGCSKGKARSMAHNKAKRAASARNAVNENVWFRHLMAQPYRSADEVPNGKLKQASFVTGAELS